MGGTSATIVVATLLTDLQNGVGTATLDTGGEISIAQLRRLACEAEIIPVVLGGDSEILDLGEGKRLYSTPQRTAMALRDKHCTARGCDWPPGLCHAHHDTEFSTGGKTDLKNGRLLCPHHHARAHDPTYDMTMHADNKVTFHRRT